MNITFLTDEEKIEAIVNHNWTAQDRIDYFIKPSIPQPSYEEPKSEQELAEEVYRGERKGDLMEKIYREYMRSDLWKERQGKPRNFDWIFFWTSSELDEFLQNQYSLLLEEREK